MDKAVWRGKIYFATDVVKEYSLERQIKDASKKGELLCPDEDCTDRRLKYCHGPIRGIYFSHVNNCSCDYSKFDRETPDTFKNAARVICSHLKNMGLSAQSEVKVISHHITPVLIFSNNRKLAIEFGNQKTSKKHIDDITSKYRNANIDLQWVIVTDVPTPNEENDELCFWIRRYLLNESKSRSVLEIDESCQIFRKYIIDHNKYTFDGKEYSSENYPNKCQQEFQISELTLENNELTVSGFHVWSEGKLQKKKEKFDEMVQRLRADKAKQEAIKKVAQKAPAPKPDAFPAKTHTQSNVYDPNKYRPEVKPLFGQHDREIVDSTGMRWYMCVNCKKEKPRKAFSLYGYGGKINDGVCTSCYNKNPKRWQK